MIYSNQVDEPGGLALSRCSSVVALITYGAYLYFQLVTHTDIEDEDKEENDDKKLRGDDGNDSLFKIEDEEDDEDDDDEEEEEEDILGVKYALFWLAVITAFISVLSDVVVDNIQTAAVDLKIPKLFIAAIVVPIIGNAAEHASAIVFALKNKLNITLGVAVGSSCQIALMVMTTHSYTFIDF